MAIELKDVLESLGVDADPEKLTVDEFKTQVGGKYILRDAVLKDENYKKTFTGAAFGKLATKTRQLFELKTDDVVDKDFEEILGIVKTKYDAKLADLESKVGQPNDKKVEDLMKKLTEKDNELALKENGLKEWETKFNTEVTERENKLKSYKLTDRIGKVQQSLSDKFTDEYKKNDLVKSGFEAHINNTYSFELDEKDEPIVKLKADGSIVKSKSKIGHSATPDEIFLMEMDAKGVLKKNNAENKKVITTFAIEGDKGKTKVHPNALKNVARFQ